MPAWTFKSKFDNFLTPNCRTCNFSPKTHQNCSINPLIKHVEISPFSPGKGREIQYNGDQTIYADPTLQSYIYCQIPVDNTTEETGVFFYLYNGKIRPYSNSQPMGQIADYISAYKWFHVDFRRTLIIQTDGHSQINYETINAFKFHANSMPTQQGLIMYYGSVYEQIDTQIKQEKGSTNLTVPNSDIWGFIGESGGLTFFFCRNLSFFDVRG